MKVNEAYESIINGVDDDDYHYFKRQISKGNISVEDIENDRLDIEKSLLMTARSHWNIGNDTNKKFPERKYVKIISTILDDMVKK